MNVRIIVLLIALSTAMTAMAQNGLKKVYDEEINPLEQIDQAVVKAKSEGKYVICQVVSALCRLHNKR